MIRVVAAPDGWSWQMIGADGAVLVYVDEVWPTDRLAFAAAVLYRAAFWTYAARRDGRSAGCF